MMISPESYYECELKGKSREEILTCIRSLKQQMGTLKNHMENPLFEHELVCPTPDTVLYWTREYLAMAKRAYADTGGEYHKSAAEKRSAAFLERLNDLKKIEFNIGGYFGGHNVYQLEVTDDGLHLTGMHFPSENPLPVDKTVLNMDEEEIRTSDELCHYLCEMHIEEWHRYYDTERFGYTVSDGTQWELKFEYSTGHRQWISEGSNSYPWNFDDLCKLFGEADPREVTEEDEDDEDN